MQFEERCFVAMESLGDFDACVLDYFRLTDVVNVFNQNEVALLCARDIYLDRTACEEEHTEELLNRR